MDNIKPSQGKSVSKNASIQMCREIRENNVIFKYQHFYVNF